MINTIQKNPEYLYVYMTAIEIKFRFALEFKNLCCLKLLLWQFYLIYF